MSVEDEADLRDQLIRALEENGFLHKLRAKLRAGVFLALEEKPAAKKSLTEKRRKVEAFEERREGKESLALVYDLCRHLHLTATLSVLTKEANITEEILEHLPVKDATDTPGIVSLLRAKTNDLGDLPQNERDTFPKRTRKHSPHDDNKDDFPREDAGRVESKKRLDVEKPILVPVDSLLESIEERKTPLAPLVMPKKVEEQKDEEGFMKKSPPKASDWLTGSSKEPLADQSPPNLSLNKDKPDSGSKSLLGDLPGMGAKGPSSSAKSFLSDLPDLSGKKALPPVSGGKTSLGGSGNFMKLLNDSLENIENDEAIEESLSESKSESESETPSARTPQIEPKKSLEKQEAVSTDTTEDDSISEIVEDLEVDNLLNSGRSEASF